MKQTLEMTLAYHCAPALVGLKPANLISCDHKRFPNLEQELIRLNTTLGPGGIQLLPICNCDQRTLLLVFRRDCLHRHLCAQGVLEYLARAGYHTQCPQAILLHLQERLTHPGDFPHEMGVILGYPVADVEGYLLHGGKNCKLTGYWKVYTNEAQARTLFSRYTCARNTLFTRVSGGIPIAKLLGAA